MKSSQIKEGETYIFVATDSASRKHLEGEPFTVVRIQNVWRRINKGRRKVKRFFNEAGDGARADELEPRSLTDGINTDYETPEDRRRTTAQEPPIDDLPF